ncbi:MAG: hypothetical protein ACRES3_09765 [Steroidobacteraceae bacterium]
MRWAFSTTTFVLAASIAAGVDAQPPRPRDAAQPRPLQPSTQPVQQSPPRLEGVAIHGVSPVPCGGAKLVAVAVLTQIVPQPPAFAPGSGDVVVKLQSTRPDFAKVPESVRIPPGEQAGRFEVTTVPIAAKLATARIVARLGNETAESNVLSVHGPRIVGITGGPGGECGGETEKLTARFDCPAPSSGLRISFSGSGQAEGSEAIAVHGGDSASDKVRFRRCCLSQRNARCDWRVNAHLRDSDGGSVAQFGRSGSCGQPDSCPN